MKELYLPIIENKRLSLYINEELGTFFMKGIHKEIQIYHIQDIIDYHVVEDKEIVILHNGCKKVYCKQIYFIITIRGHDDFVKFSLLSRKLAITSPMYHQVDLLMKQYDFVLKQLLGKDRND